MGADVLRRDQLRGPPLDLLAGEGVGHVGGPDPLHPLEHPEVDASATGGARLPVDAGMGLAQRVEQRVEAEASAGGPTGAPPSGAAAGLQQVAVVVPLHRVDRVRRQHRADLLEDVVAHLRPGKVEHQLVAMEQRNPVAGGEDPVGVLAEEVGVGVDHLRLEPEPELHAEPVHVLDQRSEALGPDGGSTCQSPRPAVSSRRPANQPSSSTKRSTPIRAARSAIAVSRSRSWSK